jgi:hypothetical protein
LVHNSKTSCRYSYRPEGTAFSPFTTALPRVYKVLDPFTAVEATSPPSVVHDRDHST